MTRKPECRCDAILVQINIRRACVQIASTACPNFEHKTIASLKLSVEELASLILTGRKKRAEDLDAHHPGSTCLRAFA